MKNQKITQKSDGNTIIYYFNGIKKYKHYMASENSFEYWKEYDKNGKKIYFVCNSGIEERWVYNEDGNEIFYTTGRFNRWKYYNNDGKEIFLVKKGYDDDDDCEIDYKRWNQYDKDGELAFWNDNKGQIWWSENNPNNPKNKLTEVKTENFKPFEFCKHL